jgi:type II secretory pathway component PulM
MTDASRGVVPSSIALRWDRASPRERRWVIAAAIVVVGALAWALVWVPMNGDIARTRDALARDQALLASARAQRDESVALERIAPRAQSGDPRAAVERVLATRGLRTPATQIDEKDGRVRVVLDAVAFPALMSALGTLARDENLRVAEGALSARVEPGSVRADLTLAR